MNIFCGLFACPLSRILNPLFFVFVHVLHSSCIFRISFFQPFICITPDTTCRNGIASDVSHFEIRFQSSFFMLRINILDFFQRAFHDFRFLFFRVGQLQMFQRYWLIRQMYMFYQELILNCMFLIRHWLNN